MTVTPAALSRPQSGEGSAPFVPTGGFRGRLADFDYVEEEWFASGEVDGHPYVTTVFVRRPRDPNRFSGTVMVEPLHAMSAAPVWLYMSDYLMRAGHGWAASARRRRALDAAREVRSTPSATSRSTSGRIRPPPDDAARWTRSTCRGDPAAMQPRFGGDAERRTCCRHDPRPGRRGASRRRPARSRAATSRHVILAGHSQTGGVVTDYIRNAHDAQRRDDGSPVYDGYFPSGAPGVTFGGYDVPIVQVVSDGDISDPHRAGRESRKYRRADSDEPGDRYRLYELAGVPHMGTRYPPYNDPRCGSRQQRR